MHRIAEGRVGSGKHDVTGGYQCAAARDRGTVHFRDHDRGHAPEPPADPTQSLQEGRKGSFGRHRIQIESGAEGRSLPTDPEHVAGSRIDRLLHLREASLEIIENT